MGKSKEVSTTITCTPFYLFWAPHAHELRNYGAGLVSTDRGWQGGAGGGVLAQYSVTVAGGIVSDPMALCRTDASDFSLAIPPPRPAPKPFS